MTLPPNAVDLAISELARSRSDVNTRRGSAVRLLLVDPWALINQPVVTETNALRTKLSIANLESLSEEDLDELAANLMIARRPGRYATGVMRLYFGSASSFSIPTSVRFKSTEGPEFSPISARDVTAAELRLNVDGDLYYLDIAVKALSMGVAGNVLAETVSTLSSGPTEIVRVTNPDRFIGGEDKETNARFAKRIPDAIAARSIVNQPGVRTVITSKFDQVTAIQEIGFGDVEMERDVVSGTGLTIGGEAVGSSSGVHIGGKIDIYVRTPAYLQQGITLIAAAGEVRPVIVFGRAAAADNEVAATYAPPMLGVLSIQLGDAASGVCTGEFLVEGTDYEVAQENPGNAFSMRGVTLVRLLESSSRYAEITEGVGRSLQVTYLTNEDIPLVQSFVDDGNVRHVCADVLVKSMIPVFVDVDVTFKPTPENELKPGEAVVTSQVVVDTVRSFFEQSENLNGFNVDDLYRVLYSMPVDRVNKPITIRTSMVDQRGVTSVSPAATEPDILVLTASLPSVANAIRVTVPANLGHVGASIGDIARITWAGGSAEREVVAVERAQPTDTSLTVLRVATAFPKVSVPATLTLHRRTVQNIASIPRTAALIPRTIRAFELAV